VPHGSKTHPKTVRLPWKNHHVDGILVGKTLAFSYAYVCVPEGVWDILFKIVLTIIRYFHPKKPFPRKSTNQPFLKGKKITLLHPFTKRKTAKNKIKTKTLCFSESFFRKQLIYIYRSTYKYHLNF